MCNALLRNEKNHALHYIMGNHRQEQNGKLDHFQQPSRVLPFHVYVLTEYEGCWQWPLSYPMQNVKGSILIDLSTDSKRVTTHVQSSILDSIARLTTDWTMQVIYNIEMGSSE